MCVREKQTEKQTQTKERGERVNASSMPQFPPVSKNYDHEPGQTPGLATVLKEHPQVVALTSADAL